MAMYDELPVYKATYDLLLAIFKFTTSFSKEYKYTVGETLKKETIDLLTLIYRANSRYDKTDTLQSAREQIEVIRLMIRLMKDMRQITLVQFVQVNMTVENVSKQLNGWQKSSGPAKIVLTKK
jgi:23S rRNA-intervening sequence protein